MGLLVLVANVCLNEEIFFLTRSIFLTFFVSKRGFLFFQPKTPPTHPLSFIQHEYQQPTTRRRKPPPPPPNTRVKKFFFGFALPLALVFFNLLAYRVPHAPRVAYTSLHTTRASEPLFIDATTPFRAVLTFFSGFLFFLVFCDVLVLLHVNI